ECFAASAVDVKGRPSIRVERAERVTLAVELEPEPMRHGCYRHRACCVEVERLGSRSTAGPARPSDRARQLLPHGTGSGHAPCMLGTGAALGARVEHAREVACEVARSTAERAAHRVHVGCVPQLDARARAAYVASAARHAL